jgi:hypothetical protein
MIPWNKFAIDSPAVERQIAAARSGASETVCTFGQSSAENGTRME